MQVIMNFMSYKVPRVFPLLGAIDRKVRNDDLFFSSDLHQ